MAIWKLSYLKRNKKNISIVVNSSFLKWLSTFWRVIQDLEFSWNIFLEFATCTLRYFFHGILSTIFDGLFMFLLRFSSFSIGLTRKVRTPFQVIIMWQKKGLTLGLEKEWKDSIFCMSSFHQKCCNGTSS